MKRHAHMLYAWCRYCDDVIDGQNLGFAIAEPGAGPHVPRREDLDFLRRQTQAAINGETVTEPAFLALQEVVQATNMPPDYPFDLLRGFQMDVEAREYRSLNDTLEYCYYVAGVVGVMMAIIMGVDQDDHDTLNRACDLGIAFQLTNICRDIIDDAEVGRVYLPAAWLEEAGVPATPEAMLDRENRHDVWSVALRVLEEADRYYKSSGPGVRRLPIRAGFAVAAARGVYRDIGPGGAQARHARLGCSGTDVTATQGVPRRAWVRSGGNVEIAFLSRLTPAIGSLDPTRPLTESASDKPSSTRMTWIGCGLAAAIIASWATLHVVGVHSVTLSWATMPWVPVFILAQSWLSVGLFIIAHDAVHGSLAPGRPAVNRTIGWVTMTLYAGL